MQKKVVKKSVTRKSAPKAKPVVEQRQNVDLKGHASFLAVLLLVVGFSGYAIFSSFSSNNGLLNYTFADVSSDKTNKTALATKEGATGSSENQKPSPFSDVNYGDDNAEAIIALYYAGVVNGYNDGTFKPENKVNRAEFMKMLAEARDVDYADIDAAVLANCFSDVKDVPEHWYAPPVCAGKYYGWVNGYSDGTFKPSQNINKAEALKITLTAFGFEIPANSSVKSKPYNDITLRTLFAMASEDADIIAVPSGKLITRPLTSWYVGVAQAAKDAGLIPSGGNFDAGHELTRGEMASIIYKAMLAKSEI